MTAIHSPRQTILSLTPGFSPVLASVETQNCFNGFVSVGGKPLKRFINSDESFTRLKPGANETGLSMQRTMPHVCGLLKRCRASLATAVHIATALAMILFCGRAIAQTPVEGDSAVRFRTVDIYVDSKDKPLAAYQLEFSATNGNAKITGIEGGEHPEFAAPPHYDPKAMQQERVIIAAFSTNVVSALPVGKTRVVTVHLQTDGAAELRFELKLQAAADAAGKKIQTEAYAEERKPL